MILRKITAYIIVILALWGSFQSEAAGESLEFSFEHFSSDDGLPHNSISDIHHDKRGYLWLCTWYGLSRFDGNGFVNYTMMPGDYSNLSHNRILSVTEDSCGYLWVMTYDYHLYRFDVNKEAFTAVPSELENFPASGVTVSNLHCDKEGNVWISLSGSGLMKIAPDLSYTHFFNVSESNVGKNVSAIYEDSAGTIYVVSETGITSIKDGSTILLSRTSDVLAFAEKDGFLFFASPDQLLSIKVSTREQKKADLETLGAGEATSMILTGRDSLLFIGFKDNAVARVEPMELELEVFKTDMGRVRYLFPDPENLLWIATERTGIWSYDAAGNRFRHYEHPNNVMSYYADTLASVKSHDGRLWIKMNNYGFGYYDRCCDRIVPLNNVKEHADSRFMNGVPCYDIDEAGILWMSTAARGLEKVVTITPKVERINPPTQSEDQKSSSEIRAMLRDSKGNIWVAAKSRELYRYSPDLSECQCLSGGRMGDLGVIYSIFEDDKGYIWLGTKGDGLIRLKPDGDGFVRTDFRADASDQDAISSNNIYSVTQDRNGRIWVGTYGGGLSMLPSSDSESFVSVKNNFPDYPQDTGDRVRYLHCMPDGRMLVATVGGLILFEPSEIPELTVFNLIRKIPGDRNSLGNNDVIHIFTDRKGNVWLCTFGGGLNRMYFEDGVPRFDIISTEDGLVSNIIHSAVDDKHGLIWIATEAGLSSYDPETSVVRNYSKYDGIMPTSYSEATCVCAVDGSVLFGTYDNVYKIDPDNFHDSEHDSRLIISGLSIDGVRTPFEERIVIPHGYSFFRIDFASLDFYTNGSRTFSYVLEGYDKKWISGSGSNQATYSRIPPGKYTFRVSDTFGAADEDSISISVLVRPSIWNSVPAIIIYVIIGILLLAVFFRFMIMSVKMRNAVKLEQGFNDIKARFFTNVSHELRTPLTLILGGIGEISKNTKPGDQCEYSVNIVQKNAKRMLTLVNQLLDTRSIVDGQMHLNISQFDVVKLVQGVYDDFRDMSSERRMEMRMVRSVDSLLVCADSIRLEALVYNLLSNAFKYTSDGGKIEVGVLYREGDKDFRIMVKDNGIGIPKESQKVIFERFTKGNASSFSGVASSGIGLSFCKEIADIHGGDIWVESRQGEGSKFFVRLPVQRDAHKFEVYGLSKYKVEASYPEGAMKVLVVEDNAELKVYIYNSLAGRYEVRDAANGKDALDVISGGWMPDIVVTDLMMPVMDGMELINTLRNDFNTSHIPILMITAKHEDDTHVRAMKYGADGYLSKPFSMELLIARIDNMLSRRRQLVSDISSRVAGADSENKTKRIEILPEEIVITDKDEQLIQKIMKWLEDNVSDAEVTVDQLAAYVGMGRTSMYNKVKGLTGKSPVELIQEFRMEKATYYLKSGQYSVSETSYRVGFSDPGYFSRSFKKHFGISPADYIKQNKK